MTLKDNFKKDKLILLAGITLFLCGLIVNQWLLVKLFPFLSENLTLPRKILIWSLDLFLMGWGALLIIFRNNKKKIFFSGVLALLILFVSLTGAEVLIRIIFTHYSTRYYSEYPYQRDPQTGLIHRANFEGEIESAEAKKYIKANSEGFRSSEEFIIGDGENKVIAVLGDSFVEGHELEEEETFVKLLEKELKDLGIAQAQNYGIGGTGIVHYLQRYKYYARKHNPSIVIISVLPDNDFRNCSPVLEKEDTIRPSYSFDSQGNIKEVLPFKVETGQFSTRAFQLFHKIDGFFATYSAIYQLLSFLENEKELMVGYKFPVDALIYEEPWNDEFKEAFKYASWALGQLVDEIRQDGAHPIIALMAAQWETNDQRWKMLEESYQSSGGENKLNRDRVRIELKKLAEEMGVDFVDPTNELRGAYAAGKIPLFPINLHYNTLGHQIVAQVLAEKISEILTK